MVLALANTAKKRRPLRQRAQSERAHLSLSFSLPRAPSLSLYLARARSPGQILLLSPVDTAGNTRIASRMDCWKSLLRDYPFISFHFRPVTQSRLHLSIHPCVRTGCSDWDRMRILVLIPLLWGLSEGAFPSSVQIGELHSYNTTDTLIIPRGISQCNRYNVAYTLHYTNTEIRV